MVCGKRLDMPVLRAQAQIRESTKSKKAWQATSVLLSDKNELCKPNSANPNQIFSHSLFLIGTFHDKAKEIMQTLPPFKNKLNSFCRCVIVATVLGAGLGQSTGPGGRRGGGGCATAYVPPPLPQSEWGGHYAFSYHPAGSQTCRVCAG